VLLPAPSLGGLLEAGTPTRYQRHRPETSLLYRIVELHYPAFLARLESEGRSPPD
jgi:hypothetical protein